ncbi:MAG: histone deacetylase [Gemmataceae bacterium]|jgi:acetoin utilization deacetylase AcuC-like enzyme|nr:histone deacetylase [Gemmataceae bacterium]
MLKLFYTDHFVLPLPEGHTFPMSKYRLLRERVVNSGLIQIERQLILPHAATDEELALAHEIDYIQAMSRGTISEADMKRIGFPWSPQLVERSRRSNGATIEACYSALDSGYGINLAGGTHHAFRDHGEGYCLFNDAVIGLRQMQRESRIQRAAIIDLDVHQGNGTAALCRLDPSLFTFSMHGEKNYPLRKETSDLDIELADGTTDQEYLDHLEDHLPQVLEKSRAEMVVYLAGADPFEGDRLGRLKLSKKGLLQRDQMVVEQCKRNGVPMVIVMAGGYAHNVIDTVDIHWQTIQYVLEQSSSRSLQSP